MRASTFFIVLATLLFSNVAHTQDTIELETTTIKGNSELPKYLYVVPWQDKKSEVNDAQKLVLHNLYSDLFDPLLPQYISAQEYKLKTTQEK